MSQQNSKIKLTQPIKQGENSIKTLELRKPMSGELRGIKLLDIMQMDISAYIPLLSRITTPLLHEKQINQLDTVDLMEIMTTVQGFFIASNSKSM